MVPLKKIGAKVNLEKYLAILAQNTFSLFMFRNSLCSLFLLLCFGFCFAASDAEKRDYLTKLFDQMDGEEKKRVLSKINEYKLATQQQKTCDPFCNDPDCGKNVTQLILSKGYPCEEHYALTSDGYWLSLQRIPHGRDNNTSSSPKPVVFLQHGLLDASHTWVINMPEESLGFILADEGYDVWLGNNRGNTYSDTNEFYHYDDSDFWNFSWDEMASIDLPTQIDYALKYTGQKQLFYVGHSEGTTQAFSGFQNTTLASQIKLFVALAPVAYVGDMTSEFIRTLAFLHVDTVLEVLGFNHFLVQSCILDDFLDSICAIDDAALCQVGMCVLAGCNPSNMNASRYDVYMLLSPAGTSMQNINHWGQMVRKDNFCSYDYLTRHENEKHYGQSSPPCYDLSKMAAPVALFAGGKDKLGDKQDVARLEAELNPDMIVFSTTISYYEHMDFVWGMDAAVALYPQIISLFRNYQ